MENLYIIALLKCRGIGTTKLLKYVKDNDFNIARIKSNIKNLISEDDYLCFDKILEEAKYEIESNLEKRIKLITLLDDRFPSKLYNTVDPVLYLYYRGDISLLDTPSVAIIGTRHPSDVIVDVTEKISGELSKEGLTIVSGLALGVDKAAHKGCLNAGGKTIAVLPSSIDNIQPSSHKDFAMYLLENCGLLVSEYPVGSILSKFNYAKRDRIQSALSSVILVTEAKEDSGTMIAVKKSLNEGKAVYQLSTNDNNIIKNNIDLDNDDYINIIKEAVNKDLNKEDYNVIDEDDDDNEQISLF